MDQISLPLLQIIGYVCVYLNIIMQKIFINKQIYYIYQKSS